MHESNLTLIHAQPPSHWFLNRHLSETYIHGHILKITKNVLKVVYPIYCKCTIVVNDYLKKLDIYFLLKTINVKPTTELYSSSWISTPIPQLTCTAGFGIYCRLLHKILLNMSQNKHRCHITFVKVLNDRAR